ncbi:MAG: GtrA family protein [Polyangiaceae bacterium]
MRAKNLALLARHQLASIVATAVDFSTMVLAVEVAGLSAVWGTVIGAFHGGVANFLANRYWTFSREGSLESSPVDQGAKYVIVSACSLLWNALGEHLLVRVGLHYVIARVLVAVSVGLLWNYPLHRGVVFAVGSKNKS